MERHETNTEWCSLLIENDEHLFKCEIFCTSQLTISDLNNTEVIGNLPHVKYKLFELIPT